MVYAVIEPVVREEVTAPATMFTGIKFIQIKQSVTVSTAYQMLWQLKTNVGVSE